MGEHDVASFTPGPVEAYASVSAALWDERDALETLLFRLVGEQLVLRSGATRWLNRADHDVRHAIDRMREAELVRAAETDALARAIAAAPEVTLGELAAGADEPWAGVLGEHRVALRSLVAEIRTVAAENRRLLDAGAGAVQETLDHLGESVATYDASGASVTRTRGPLLIDEQA